jgi:hypothetical protein
MEAKRLKKYAATLVILAAVLICASAPVMAAPDPGDKFMIYENKVHNFSIQYPLHWKVVEGFMGSVVAFGSPPESPGDKFSENINIAVEDLTAYPDMTLAKYEELGLAQLTSVMTDFKLMERRSLTISGVPAKQAIFTCRQGVFQLKLMQTYLLADNKALVITFAAEEATYREYEKVAKTMINSVLLK